MKFHVFVIGRLKSRRLPLKALLPLSQSFTVSSFLFERLSLHLSSDRSVSITYVTSYLDSDLPLKTHLETFQYPVYCGHPTNVFHRLLDADKHFSVNADFFIRVTADNPFTCPFHIKDLMSWAESHPLTDYAIHPTLHTGLRSELISSRYLKRISDLMIDPESSEYMSFLLDRPDHGLIAYLQPIAKASSPYCYTVDVREQYNYISTIVDRGFSVCSTLQDLYDISDSIPASVLDSEMYKRPSLSTLQKHNAILHDSIQ